MERGWQRVLRGGTLPDDNFYTLPITASGFGTATEYPGIMLGWGPIHYDATTGYVYSDGGEVINPANGAVVGNFNTSATFMVPDGSVGLAFFLSQTPADGTATTYTIKSFDINTFTPVGTLIIQNVNQYPTRLIRWGTSGLAFTTSTGFGASATGALYIINSSFVTDNKSRSLPRGNAQRTWKPTVVQSRALP